MSQKHTLTEIESEVKRLAAKINASADLLPTYGYSEDGARPHIEVDSRAYHYVVVERGEEISRMTTDELDELLYNVFDDATFQIASTYELKHRVEEQDSRRILFQRQIELLSLLSPKWGQLQAEDHERILRQHPYDDQANSRADLAKELREQGISPELAWKRACEKYPLPQK